MGEFGKDGVGVGKDKEGSEKNRKGYGRQGWESGSSEFGGKNGGVGKDMMELGS